VARTGTDWLDRSTAEASASVRSPSAPLQCRAHDKRGENDLNGDPAPLLPSRTAPAGAAGPASAAPTAFLFGAGGVPAGTFRAP
jgi:hypothetical protein